jgi:hypothetical protein
MDRPWAGAVAGIHPFLSELVARWARETALSFPKMMVEVGLSFSYKTVTQVGQVV